MSGPQLIEQLPELASSTIPPSNATVSVKVIDGGGGEFPATHFLHPVLPGHEIMRARTHCFFVENQRSHARVVFDLGIRKDFENSPPALVESLKHLGATIVVEKDVAEQLKGAGVELGSVSAVIWSHSHLDHVGNPATFPTSTKLVVGPGTREFVFPPYPENPQGAFLASDIENREVVEVSFDDSISTIGGFKARDYFGDGSFYLLDVPGHMIGHMAGLARVTPTSFILMGGDTCHHVGQLRPNSALQRHFPCPGTLLESARNYSIFSQSKEHPGTSLPDTPLLTIPIDGQPSVYREPPIARQSLTKVATSFDADPNVFVVLAHDTSLGDLLPLFPESVDDWKEKDLKEKSVWRFLEKNNPAFRFD